MRGSNIASHLGLLRARPMVVVVGGMLASVALSVLLYSVSSLLHPPSPYGQPGAPATVGAWIAAYASWSEVNGDLAVGFRACIVAAVSFAVAAGVLLRPRAMFVASFALLNVYFAWTSSAIKALSVTLELDMTRIIYNQDGSVLALLNLGVVTGNTYVVADLEALAFLTTVAASVLVMNFREGYRRAAVRALRAVAGCFVILGAEIALFDYKEFYLHATQTQSAFGWATWFTNADLFLVGLVLLASTTYALRLGRIGSTLY